MWQRPAGRTTLEFDVRNGPSYDFLDNVLVIALPDAALRISAVTKKAGSNWKTEARNVRTVGYILKLPKPTSTDNAEHA
jgi:hypothetical protein